MKSINWNLYIPAGLVLVAGVLAQRGLLGADLTGTVIGFLLGAPAGHMFAGRAKPGEGTG